MWVRFLLEAQNMQKNRSKLYGGAVWVLSGIALACYASMGLSQESIPGVEELVHFVQGAEGWHIYVAAFLGIFFEGLYFIGSVIPGSSFVVLTAIVSQASGFHTFLGVILAIFIGWNIAGVANVLIAKTFSSAVLKNAKADTPAVDMPEVTWFPAFRANTEVAQITEGHSVSEVLLSSLRVKTLASIGAAFYTLAIPFFIDINTLNNEEGFTGLFVIALISAGVGVYKIYEYKKEPSTLVNDSVPKSEN